MIKLTWKSLMVTLDRIAAWTLLVVALLFGVSGYGMTRGIIDPAVARALHLHWLVPVGLLALIVHASWAIRLALRRWRCPRLLARATLVTGAGVLALSFAHLQFACQPARAARSAAAQRPAPPVPRRIGQAELHAADGRAGKPAYFVVDGLVHDGSTLFVKGLHAGAAAGQDLSKDCRGCHEPREMNDYLRRYPVVGRFGNQEK